MKRTALFLLLTTLGLSSNAHACELICVQTLQTYTGDLGGFTGADAKCAAEFPGFKFMRAPYSMFKGGAAFVGGAAQTNLGFVNAVPNCNAWTNGSTGGSVMLRQIRAAAGVDYPEIVSETTSGSCSFPERLWCCNM